MRIGVISDTHVTSFAGLPDKIITALADVDVIIHAGDFTAKAVLDGLKQFREVKAVCGNMDSNELKQLLPDKEPPPVQTGFDGGRGRVQDPARLLDRVPLQVPEGKYALVDLRQTVHDLLNPSV